MNCKPGDIAIITWDDEPVFSNVGKLVLVEGPYTCCIEYGGRAWDITPLNYGDGFLFVDVLGTGEVVKLWNPSEDGIRHPDEWMRPLENPDELHEEIEQEVNFMMDTTSRMKTMAEDTLDEPAIYNNFLL